MYESYYGFTAKPFQLRPDPQFFFGSKGHNRAMAYLEYGLSQEEGFIVITGEVGAGKTTLMRHLFSKLPTDKIVAAQIVNTHLDSDDILQMVAAAFGLPCADTSKSGLLLRIEHFLHECDANGKRALLVVDEAQNLTQRAVEELRMLSNFQTMEKCLLQTFLLGQPEFRKTLVNPGMLQLRQRVTATYHLGPLDVLETRAYVDHRLHTVGWQGNPYLDEGAYKAIYEFSGGIPRKINSLCDRLFLMGYLEELTTFGRTEVDKVVADIQQEFTVPSDGEETESARQEFEPANDNAAANSSLEQMDERLAKIERSVASVLDAVKRVVSTIKTKQVQEGEPQ